MKIFSLTLRIVIFFILSTNIFGDRIRLRNGTVIEGTVVRTEEKFVQIDDLERIRKIPTHIIESIEVGYTGTPVCILINSSENCQKILHSLGIHQTVFLSGKGQMETEILKTKLLKKISWKRTSPKDRFSPYIRIGIQIQISTKYETYNVIFQGKKDSDTLEFQPVADRKQKLFLKESEILQWEWRKDGGYPNTAFPNFLLPLVPGLVQFKTGESVKGGVLMAGTSLALTASVLEFQNAQNSAKPIQYLIPTSDKIVLLQTSKNRNAVRSQLQNSHLFLGFALLICAYHVWDLQQSEDSLISDLNRFQPQSAPTARILPALFAEWEIETKNSKNWEFSFIILEF